MSNAERAKRYRERIKASPEKAQAWRNKAASRMRKKRSVAQHDQTVAQQKRKPTPEERAALLAAFDEPAPSVAHLGGKHAAPATVYHGIPPEALIKQHQEHHAKQLPPEPLPLNQHPFTKLVESHLGALTLIKVAEPKSA